MFAELAEDYEILVTEFFTTIFEDHLHKSICKNLINTYLDYWKNYNVTPSITKYIKTVLSPDLINEDVIRKLKILQKMLSVYKSILNLF